MDRARFLAIREHVTGLGAFPTLPPTRDELLTVFAYAERWAWFAHLMFKAFVNEPSLGNGHEERRALALKIAETITESDTPGSYIDETQGTRTEHIGIKGVTHT
jgi:hypothetical protein